MPQTHGPCGILMVWMTREDTKGRNKNHESPDAPVSYKEIDRSRQSQERTKPESTNPPVFAPLALRQPRARPQLVPSSCGRQPPAAGAEPGGGLEQPWRVRACSGRLASVAPPHLAPGCASAHPSD